ncbi:MAG: hypothetical protein V1794_04185, partial [Candidatus Glassbacteria bacterium]
MNSGNERIPAGLRFIGRRLGELLELKARCRRRLEYLEQNREKISDYVFQKLHQEYQSYLEAVDGEVSLGLSEYEVRLSEIRLFSNQLRLLEKSYEEKIQELSLRYQLGEYDRPQYEKLCAEHEGRMKRFGRSLEKYSGQQRQLENFLGRVREERLAALPGPALAEVPETEVPPLEEEPVEAPVVEEAAADTLAAESPAETLEPIAGEESQPIFQDISAVTTGTAAPEPVARAVESTLIVESPPEAPADTVQAEKPPTQEPALMADSQAETAESAETILVTEPAIVEIAENAAEPARDDLPEIQEITGTQATVEEPEPAEGGPPTAEKLMSPVERAQEPAALLEAEAAKLPDLQEVGEDLSPAAAAEEEAPREEPQRAAEPEPPAAPVTQPPAASGGFDLEEMLELGAPGRTPEPPAAEKAAEPAGSRQASSTGPLDLDAIMSAAGEAVEHLPSSSRLQPVPPAGEGAEEPEIAPAAAQETGGTFHAAQEAPAVLTPTPNQKTETSAVPVARETEEEPQEPAGFELKEKDQGEEDEPVAEFHIERAASLEDGIELKLDFEGEEGEADK